MAGVFGLGHGMAFSFVLAEMHLSTGQLVTSLLGFNLGIELVQLLLVCLALPSLLVLVRLRVQPVLRMTGAALTGTVAVGWLADRLGLPNPVARAAESVGSHTTLLLAALIVTALAATAWTLITRRLTRHGPAETPTTTVPSWKDDTQKRSLNRIGTGRRTPPTQPRHRAVESTEPMHDTCCRLRERWVSGGRPTRAVAVPDRCGQGDPRDDDEVTACQEVPKDWLHAMSSTPAKSGWSSGNTPLAIGDTTTGAPTSSASRTRAPDASHRTAPAPASTTGRRA